MRPNTKWERRDKKREKRTRGMGVDGRSVFTLRDIIYKGYKNVKNNRSKNNSRNR